MPLLSVKMSLLQPFQNSKIVFVGQPWLHHLGKAEHSPRILKEFLVMQNMKNLREICDLTDLPVVLYFPYFLYLLKCPVFAHYFDNLSCLCHIFISAFYGWGCGAMPLLSVKMSLLQPFQNSKIVFVGQPWLHHLGKAEHSPRILKEFLVMQNMKNLREICDLTDLPVVLYFPYFLYLLKCPVFAHYFDNLSCLCHIFISAFYGFSFFY